MFRNHLDGHALARMHVLPEKRLCRPTGGDGPADNKLTDSAVPTSTFQRDSVRFAPTAILMHMQILRDVPKCWVNAW